MSWEKVWALIVAAVVFVCSLFGIDISDKIGETTTAIETTVIETTTQSVSETTTQNVSETTTQTVPETTTNGVSETTTAQGSIMPTTIAEIVAYYNQANQKMVTSKPALHKIKKTTYKDINLGTIPSLVGFTGLFSSYTMDPKEYDVVKGSLRPKNQAKDAYILSSLTQSDVSAATCKENGQRYEITLTIKGGAISQTSNGSIGKYQNDFENISETIASSAKDGITADSFTGNVNSASAYIIADKTTKQITAMKFSSEVTYIAKNPRVDGTLYTTQVKYTAVTTSEFSSIVY